MSIEKKLFFLVKRPDRVALVALMLAFAIGLHAQITPDPVTVTGISAGQLISASTVSTNFTNLSNNDTAINGQLTKLDSAKWTYTSGTPNQLSYTGGNLNVTGGNVGIGTTTPTYLLHAIQSSTSPTACIANLNGKAKGYSGVTDPNEALRIIGGNDTGNGGALIQFYRPGGYRLGYICQNSNNEISWGNDSDRRLKEGIVDTRYSLDQLLKIQVRDFFFKNDPVKQLQTGFIAQELYDVYPDAVLKPEGEEGTWGVDFSRLTPLIVKSIQDQQKTIEALEAENAELKAEIAAIKKKLGL